MGHHGRLLVRACKSAVAFMAALDELVVRVGVEYGDNDEYFKPSATVYGSAVALRFAMDRVDDGCGGAAGGKLAPGFYDLNLRLVGILFDRKDRLLSTLWRMVEASPLTWTAADAAADANYLDELEEEDDSAPTVDECVNMRDQLTHRLRAIECNLNERLTAIRHNIDLIKAAPVCDMRTLDSVDAFLAETTQS